MKHLLTVAVLTAMSFLSAGPANAQGTTKNYSRIEELQRYQEVLLLTKGSLERRSTYVAKMRSHARAGNRYKACLTHLDLLKENNNIQMIVSDAIPRFRGETRVKLRSHLLDLEEEYQDNYTAYIRFCE